MEEQDSTSLPEDPPVTIKDQEVDHLLNQAQFLADDIASTTGVEPDERGAGSSSQAPATDGPDPLAAAQSVEQQIAKLDDLIADAKAESEGPSPRPPTSDASTGKSKAAPVRDGASGFSDLDFDADFADDVDVSLDDTAEPTGGQAQRKAPPVPKRLGVVGLIRRMPLASRDAALGCVKRVAVAFRDTVVTVFVALDRPFANVSPVTKKHLGYVALITVLMGIACLILPGLLEHNPYEDMAP
ncbi:MAG: hypothetical protein JXQ75_09960 [Phycisphaerae bacterium]|nr:hypothetical protein [Phycisphaerae bacterium]